MRQLSPTISVLLLLFAVAQTPAQTVATPTHSDAPLRYDISQETTLNGTVADLLTKPALGMLPGSHLLLTTLNGTVDVSLGAFALQGKGALSVSAGQQVEVTGVMKRVQRNQVFLARAVKVRDTVFAIRNDHGLPVTPQTHEHANSNAQNGEIR